MYLIMLPLFPCNILTSRKYDHNLIVISSNFPLCASEYHLPSFHTKKLFIDGDSIHIHVRNFVQSTTKLPKPLYQLSLESICAYA